VKLLLADSDVHWSAIASSYLQTRGHEVWAAGDVWSALRRCEEVDLVIVDIDLAQGGAEGLVDACSDPELTWLLVGGDEENSERVRDLGERLEARYLRKPVSLLELGDSLGVRRRASLSGGLSPEALAALATWWAGRASGELSWPGRRLHLAHGAPADPAGWHLLEQAICHWPLRFTYGDAADAGDWLAMGQWLMGRARSLPVAGFMERARFQAIARSPLRFVVRAMPVPVALAQIIEDSDGSIPLGEALASTGLSAHELLFDVAALHHLKLIDLQAPMVPRAQHRGPLPRPAPTRPSSSELDSNVEQSDVREARRAMGGERPRLPGSAFRSGLAGAVRPDPGRLRQQLEAELKRLEEASPSVILGIPGDAEPELVRAAVERLRRRYQGLHEDESMGPEVQQLGRRMVEMVDFAYKRLIRGVANDRLRPSPATTPEERLLLQARELIRRRSWEQADRVLARAMELRLDHPGILAAQGWARFHRQDLPLKQRQEDAREQLLLAEQFEADNAETLFRTAVVLDAMGEAEGAYKRVARSVRLDPDRPETLELFRRLHAAQEAQKKK
jgi:CheY-like chemotaxis protein